jgi:exodeoxyribonuclease VII large subunit
VVSKERTAALANRMERVQRTGLAKIRAELENATRVLESLSYKGVLERGFVLVRGADGSIRRRAEAVKSGERLSLTFADGMREATAGGAPATSQPRATKPKANQGDLF